MGRQILAGGVPPMQGKLGPRRVKTKSPIRRVSKRQPESKLKRAILEALSRLWPRGLFWINKSTGVFDPTRGIFRKQNSKFEVAGISDILGLLDGKFIAIEVKTATNNRRPPEQVHFIQQVVDQGHTAGFVTSVTEAVELIRKGMSN